MVANSEKSKDKMNEIGENKTVGELEQIQRRKSLSWRKKAQPFQPTLTLTPGSHPSWLQNNDPVSEAPKTVGKKVVLGTNLMQSRD